MHYLSVLIISFVLTALSMGVRDCAATEQETQKDATALDPGEKARLRFDNELSWDGVVTFSSVLVGFAIYYLQHRKEQKIARREIYQRVELAANDLFKFEIEHKGTTELLWFASKLPSKESVDYECLKEYTCQLLGLFEIAVRFRREGIMEPLVFGSWVIWIWDVCTADNFPVVWDDVKDNYVPDLRTIVNEGIRIRCKSSGCPNEECPRNEFFAFMAREFKCKLIANWFKVA